jgi:transposase InsO family protein
MPTEIPKAIKPPIFPTDLLKMDVKALAQAQRAAPETAAYIDALEGKDISTISHSLYRQVQTNIHLYFLAEGVLYRLDPTASKSKVEQQRPQLVLPPALQVDALTTLHQSLGHSGINALVTQCRLHFFFPNYTQMAYNVVTNCPVCQQYRKPRVGFRGAIRDREPCYQPFVKCQLDLLNMTPVTGSFTCIALFIDEYSKFCIAWPQVTKEAKETINGLYNHVILPFGTPLTLHTDGGKEFTAAYSEEFFNSFGITHRVGTPFYPQSQGAVERHNQTFLSLMRPLIAKDLTQWPAKIPQVISIMNNKPREALGGLTPYFLIYGRHRRHPFDAAFRVPEISSVPRDFREALREQIENHLSAQKVAKQACHKINEKIRKTIEQRGDQIKYNVGERCLVYVDKIQRGKGIHKIVPKWIGPFDVIQSTDSAVRLRHTLTGQPLPSMINIKRTKPYHENVMSSFEPIPIEQMPEWTLHLKDVPESIPFEYLPRDAQDIPIPQGPVPEGQSEPGTQDKDSTVTTATPHQKARAQWFTALSPQKKACFLRDVQKLYKIISLYALAFNLPVDERGYVPVRSIVPYVTNSNENWLLSLAHYDPQDRFSIYTDAAGVKNIGLITGYNYPLLRDCGEVTPEAVEVGQIPLYIPFTPENAFYASHKGFQMSQSFLPLYYGFPKRWKQFLPPIPVENKALLKLKISLFLSKGFRLLKVNDQQRYMLHKANYAGAIPINKSTIEKIIYHPTVPLVQIGTNEWVPFSSATADSVNVNRNSTVKVILHDKNCVYVPRSCFNNPGKQEIQVTRPHTAPTSTSPVTSPLQSQSRYFLRSRPS